MWPASLALPACRTVHLAAVPARRHCAVILALILLDVLRRCCFDLGSRSDNLLLLRLGDYSLADRALAAEV